MLPTRTQKSGARVSDRYTNTEGPIGDYLSGGIAGPNSGYAVDDTTPNKSGYMDSPSGGWAPRLKMVPGGTPDPMREQQLVQRDYRPTPLNQPPSKWWLGPGPGAEIETRHNTQEYVDADGWQPKRPVGPMPKRAAPDSRRTPPPEPRLTNLLAPSRWIFTRPFDQHAARTLNGIHFSMADHRRTYPIMGMQPVQAKRNTYRVDPPPYDLDITDDQPVQPGISNQRIQQVELPLTSNRSWRLT